ncbi:hypothetical protein DCC62_26660 [candidate division KSB1 bacterium]|nr:MAG: hypothetical protein DCC62_26660 [candidate division KSB1 bacterium]
MLRGIGIDANVLRFRNAPISRHAPGVAAVTRACRAAAAGKINDIRIVGILCDRAHARHVPTHVRPGLIAVVAMQAARRQLGADHIAFGFHQAGIEFQLSLCHDREREKDKK